MIFSQSIIRATAITIYFLAGVLLFLINKEVIASTYRHIAVVVGVIATIYFIPISLIKSTQQELPTRKYLIASDIIFYLAFAYMVLIALADNPVFKIVGIVVMIINLLFCIVSYFKTEKNEKMILRLIGLHILLSFVVPMISF